VEADEAHDFLLKTGLKSEFGPVEPDQSVAKSNWRYAVSSDNINVAQTRTTTPRVLLLSLVPCAQQPCENRGIPGYPGALCSTIRKWLGFLARANLFPHSASGLGCCAYLLFNNNMDCNGLQGLTCCNCLQ
jgi:hypothetical protein